MSARHRSLCLPFIRGRAERGDERGGQEDDIDRYIVGELEGGEF